MISVAEISRRLPVWVALSDTFLDTELEPEAYRYIAAEIARAGYNEDEGETIYREDVVPAFAGNLLGVAGEWSGWPPEFVRNRVLTKRSSWFGIILFQMLMGRHITIEWSQIRAAFEDLEA